MFQIFLGGAADGPWQRLGALALGLAGSSVVGLVVCSTSPME